MEKNRLDALGVLYYKDNKQFRDTHNLKYEHNIIVVNKEHIKRSFYVVENYTTLRALGRFAETGLLKISKNQFDRLVQHKLISASEIQTYDTFNPKAKAYNWLDQEYWIVKDWHLTSFLYNNNNNRNNHSKNRGKNNNSYRNNNGGNNNNKRG